MKTIIIGGGIAGLSTAYHLLLKANQSVTIIESGQVGQRASSKAAGMITPTSEVHLGETVLLKTFLKSCELYPAFIDQLTDNQPETVDFGRRGSLMCAMDQDGVRELLRLNDFQISMGLKVRELSSAELQDSEPFLSHKIVKAVYAENEAHIDVLKLIAALKNKIQTLGGTILENCSVQSFEKQNEQIESLLLADGTKISGDRYVLATGVQTVSGLEELCKIPLRPVKGQVLSVQCAPNTLKKPVRIYQRYPIYLVPRQSGEIIIGATSEELSDEDVTAGGIMDLIYGAWQALPLIFNQPIKRTWAGLRPATSDHKPILGKSPLENFYLCLGLYRHGIMMSPYVGQELAALINEEETHLDWDTFSIKRFS